MITILFVFIGMALAGAAGFIAGTSVVGNAQRLDQHDLAERAEAAGLDLAAIANEIAAHAHLLDSLPAARLHKQWAQRLRQAAAEHLECINAINLSDLRVAAGEPLVNVSVRDAVAMAQRSEDATAREVLHG